MRVRRQRQTGGAGIVLRFERVRPRQSRGFSRSRSSEITPQFLDRTIRALKRWKFDIISMDEVCRRAVTLPTPNVCLPDLRWRLQGRDRLRPIRCSGSTAFPSPIYLPTAFPDGVGEAWWLALEELIARENRLSLVIDRKERRLHDCEHGGEVSGLRISRELDADADAAGSFIRHQRPLQALLGRPRGAVARRIDGLGRSGEARRRSPGDDRQRHGELSCRCRT